MNQCETDIKTTKASLRHYFQDKFTLYLVFIRHKTTCHIATFSSYCSRNKSVLLPFLYSFLKYFSSPFMSQFFIRVGVQIIIKHTIWVTRIFLFVIYSIRFYQVSYRFIQMDFNCSEQIESLLNTSGWKAICENGSQRILGRTRTEINETKLVSR